jgi:hypothetical protein
LQFQLVKTKVELGLIFGTRIFNQVFKLDLVLGPEPNPTPVPELEQELFRLFFSPGETKFGTRGRV